MKTSAWLAVLVLAVSAVDAQAAPKPRLKAFRSCADLTSYARREALRTNGGVGVVGRAPTPGADAISTPPMVPKNTATGPAPVSAPQDAAGSVDFSGTNTQEALVDEPDVVKTDGKRVFAVIDGTLRVIDVSGAAPVVTGTLKLDGFDQQLLVRGTRVLAIASQGFATPVPVVGVPVPTIAPLRGADTTIVTEIDASDPANPKVARTMTVPGRFVDARQHGGTARLVIDAAPDPIPLGSIRTARTSRFLGHTVLRSKLTGRTYRRPLAPCDQIRRPRRFSGLDVLAILTVDLDRGMYSLDRDGVMASAQVVYGSPGSLYVASRRYVRSIELGTADGATETETEIHRYDISDPDHTVYKATGTVPGYVLNSYALSEYDGDLRVATTDSAPWFNQGEAGSRLTVLRQDGSTLQPIGSVGGLGKGQRIYAVRFMGDKGFVVTFRQVDPLYALDLSDPTAPAVRGALELPGYSAYLHPITGDLLLGIGREGQDVQASLFDVSDLGAPARVSALDLGPGTSPVEYEPHAFLYWQPSKLAVIPLLSYTASSQFAGAVGVHVAPGDPLSVAGRIEHADAQRGTDALVQRAFVAGGKLYTLSYLGLGVARLDTLQSTGFTAF